MLSVRRTPCQSGDFIRKGISGVTHLGEVRVRDWSEGDDVWVLKKKSKRRRQEGSLGFHDLRVEKPYPSLYTGVVARTLRFKLQSVGPKSMVETREPVQ